MIKFIKIKDKYSKDAYWININHIICIRKVTNDYVITLTGNNMDIVTDENLLIYLV